LNGSDQTLSEFIDHYQAQKNNGLKYVHSQRRTVGLLETWYHQRRKRRLTLDMLSEDLVNEWLLELNEQTPKSAITLRRYRNEVFTLWRGACWARFVEHEPPQMMTPAVNRRVPVAWSRAEYQRLLTAAREVKRWYSETRIRRADFWEAAIRVARDARLWLDDLLVIRFDDIDRTGRLLIAQDERDRRQPQPLLPVTLKAIEVIRFPERDRLFPWPWRHKTFLDTFRTIVVKAGIEDESQSAMNEKAAASHEEDDTVDIKRNSPGCRHRAPRSPLTGTRITTLP